MFEYCSRNNISITSTLANFINKELPWFDENNNLINIDIIKTWDRLEIADRYINEYYKPIELNLDKYNNIGGIENLNKFRKELAFKIDEYLPKRYFIYYQRANNTYNRDIDKKLYKSKQHKVIKKFEYEKTEKEKNKDTYFKNKHKASESQINFLRALASEKEYMEIKSFNTLMMGDASMIIEYLLDKEDAPDVFFEYFERLKDRI